MSFHHVNVQTSLQSPISLEAQTADARLQIENLQKDKEVLEAKIKGYHYLGNKSVNGGIVNYPSSCLIYLHL